MLRWGDGYEHYGPDEARMLEGVGGAAAWSTVDGVDLSTVNPATGSYHMRMTARINFSNYMRRALGQSKQISGFGHRFALSALPQTENVNTKLTLAEFRDVANTQQFFIACGTEGSVHAYGAGLDHRSDPCIAAGGYHHFETKGKVANAGGYVEARINEVTVLNVVGVDTQATANAENSQFAFGMHPVVTSTVNCTMDVDDTFAWDDDASDPENTVVDWVGDKGCYYLPTIADTLLADWLKSIGVSGYPLLDDLTVNDADYISDASGTARSIFQVAALPANVAEVIAMIPVIRARKEESGTVELRGGVVVDGNESYTVTNSPSTQFAYMTPTPKTIDPSTGVAWAADAEPQLLIERTA